MSDWPIQRLREVGYDFNNTQVAISSTSSSAPTTIISCAAHQFSGAPVVVRFFSTGNTNNAASAPTNIALYESGTLIAQLATQEQGASTGGRAWDLSLEGAAIFTPAAGVHTYTVVGWTASTTFVPHAGSPSRVLFWETLT